MYQVFLTNFGYFAKDGAKFASIDEAIEVAKTLGFECAIYCKGCYICSWSPISGVSFKR